MYIQDLRHKQKQRSTSISKTHGSRQLIPGTIMNIPSGLGSIKIHSTDSSENLPPSDKPLDEQIGGDHYKSLPIQPIEYILANKLGWCEGNIVKYITRWKQKGGTTDIEKVIHYAEILLSQQKTLMQWSNKLIQ